LPPTSKGVIEPDGTAARNSENVCPAVGEVLWRECRCQLGMPRVAIRSNRRHLGSRVQVRLHGHGFVPDAGGRNSENLCPLALFREIPFCSPSLRRCAAVHKTAPTVLEPCTRAIDLRLEIGGINRAPWVASKSSSWKLSLPQRRLVSKVCHWLHALPEIPRIFAPGLVLRIPSLFGAGAAT